MKAARTSIAATPVARHIAATFLVDMVSSNKTMAAADAKLLLAEARLMLDDALQKNPTYWEAAVDTALVVSTQAKYETDQKEIRNGSEDRHGADGRGRSAAPAGGVPAA
ncbi:MAG: hypothetical protein ACRD2N_18700 [Vicinamibacterales bacterium]